MSNKLTHCFAAIGCKYCKYTHCKYTHCKYTRSENIFHVSSFSSYRIYHLEKNQKLARFPECSIQSEYMHG